MIIWANRYVFQKFERR